MLKIDKRLTINISKGSVTERMSDFLDEHERMGLVPTIERLRRWSIAGFMLQEMGSGFLDAWLAMEQDGELTGLDKEERAQKLIRHLQIIRSTDKVPAAVIERVREKEEVKPVQEQAAPADPSARKPITSIPSLANNKA